MSGIVCSQALPCPAEENVVVVDELVPSQEILMDRILIYLLTHITETSEKSTPNISKTYIMETTLRRFQYKADNVTTGQPF